MEHGQKFEKSSTSNGAAHVVEKPAAQTAVGSSSEVYLNVSSLPLPTIKGVKFYPLYLTVDGHVDEEQERTVLKQLLNNSSASQWHVGDWLVYLANKHGKDSTIHLAEELHLEYGTLANKKSVSLKVPFGLRRPELSWEHHRVIAKLKSPTEQSRWLEEAVKNNWNAYQLRSQVNGTKAATGKAGIPGVKRFSAWIGKKLDSGKLNAKDVKMLRPLFDKLQQLMTTAPAPTPVHKVMAVGRVPTDVASFVTSDGAMGLAQVIKP